MVLEELHDLALRHPGQEHGHSMAVLEAGHAGARRELQALEARGFARRSDEGLWSITTAGVREAERRREPPEEDEGR